MEIIKTEIEGVVILEPRIFRDARGYFFESFSVREFEEKVAQTTFVQDNESCSQKGVARGLRFDDPALGIEWLAVGAPLILSEKDRSLPLSGISCRRRRRDVGRQL